MNPKVFISHASEDKDRFVIEFATRLRARGVDAWVDKWEMLPGDSLVDKMFEEGIKNAQAVIIILSINSVSKRWVREELNAAMVKRINTASKLIPVIIDDCEIPECLKSTVWEKISDLKSYDKEFDRILLAIYGQYDKPQLGKPPAYATTLVDLYPDLSKLDNVILREACAQAFELGIMSFDTTQFYNKIQSFGFSEVDFIESLQVLDGRGYIDAIMVLSGKIPSFKLSKHAFDTYIRNHVVDYPKIVERIAHEIVNSDAKDNRTLTIVLGQPVILVNHILDSFADRGLISMHRLLGGQYKIRSVSPELKRMLR